MKNITLSVPDEVYRQARIAAARRDTSVSALVAQFLAEVAGDRQQQTLRSAAIDAAFGAVTEFETSDRLTRDQLHDRAFLRELESKRQLAESTS